MTAQNKPNIFLVGMMGTMKTSIGKLLAQTLSMTFIDTDDEFEKEYRRRISEVFALEGEEYFRRRETEVVKRSAKSKNAVISCGGGVPLRDENVTAIKETGVIVLLTATPECILRRTHGSDRPLLKGGDLERIKFILAERKDRYESCADIKIDTTDLTPDQCVPKIIEILEKRKDKMKEQSLKATIDSIRVLSAEAIEKAKSGHPGTPLGAAPIIAELFGNHLTHNPINPSFEGRDRFVLSVGHASSMLYSTLHLCGYDVTKEDLTTFRQLNSRLPGHPEYGVTVGVETSTGPLGQGIANAVGFALAEKILSAKYNKPDLALVDHYTYALCGDGCMMEGINYEACAIAGAWKLGKLILIYDKNDITIEGGIAGVADEDVAKRFEAQGWRVITGVDGNDPKCVGEALAQAKTPSDKPTLIIAHTTIGYGSSKAGSSASHGAPLGAEALDGLKKYLGWTEEPFTAKAETKEFTDFVKARGEKAEKAYNALVAEYKKVYPSDYASYEKNMKSEPIDLLSDEEFRSIIPTGDDSTRNHSGKILNYLAGKIENLIGGSADLGPSNMTIMKERGHFSPASPTGTNLHFGVREQAMASITNGLCLHGGFRPYCATFFVFADYMKGSMRMSALMDIPSLYILSHDSIGVGEDGPTHQPIEQLVMLRSIPNLRVWRPCDGIETASAYAGYLASTHPTAIVTSRQKLTAQGGSIDKAIRGGYVLVGENETPDVILMGTGSEVGLCVTASKLLKEKGISARVVSLPCMEEFEAQSEEYKNSVLPSNVRARVAVEAGSSYSWGKYVGLDGVTICKDDFGASAPANVLFELYGFTAEKVVESALKTIEKTR